jgi:omega-amidase
MIDQIRITLVQPAIIWEDAASNFKMLNSMLESRIDDSDLIILPETFSTGFTMNADAFAEEGDGASLNWMREMAKGIGIHISGSIISREGGKNYNRLYWVSPDGVEGYYDKRHLFRMGRENENFTAGDTREVFNLGDFRFLPQICYDLRFPVFSRNRNDYDILYYVANWPAPRHSVWETLLRARAIENQAYVIGVSRSGSDGLGVDHLGGSCLVDPTGRVEQILGPEPGMLNLNIELKKIREFREKFPVWKDADMFSLE